MGLLGQTEKRFGAAADGSVERTASIGLIGWAEAAQDRPYGIDERCAACPSVGRQQSVEFNEFEELFQPSLLVTSQPLRFGEHPFDHFPRFVPIAADTCVHELVAGSGTRAVRGDDVSDDGGKLIDNLHDATSFAVCDQSTNGRASARFLWNPRYG